MLKTELIFGIDGGGTRSRIALATLSGEVIYTLEGRSTNAYASDNDMQKTITDLINNACLKAGVSITSLIAGCLGNAGLSRPNEKVQFKRYFESFLGKDVPVLLCNDAEILLAGGAGGVQGLCIITGTGSIALGRDADGMLIRAGGLGWRLGDEGSAWWIAQQGVQRTLRSLEGRDLETSLLQPLLSYFRLERTEDFVALFNGTKLDKACIAAVAPLVTRAGLEGDLLALDILHEAANELVSLVVSVVRRMPKLSDACLVYAGGVLQHDQVVMPKFAEQLSNVYPDMILTKGKGDALDGAVLLAKDALKKRITRV